MSSEEAEEQLSVSVPEELRSWVEQAADERGASADEFLRELLAAHRALETGDGAAAAESEFVAEDALDAELSDLRDEFWELVEDVRSRVIQVKQEADAKAPVEHEHEEIAAELDELDDAIDDLSADLETHREDLATLRETVDDGFENFESVLEYLLETTDGLVDRTDRLARATITTREHVEELGATVGRRHAADRLTRDAVLEGVGKADCEACGQQVRTAHLTAPECPYCSATFVDVEGKDGLFSSATWKTGDRPALAGVDAEPMAEELDDDLGTDRPDTSDVDWDTAGDDE